MLPALEFPWRTCAQLATLQAEFGCIGVIRKSTANILLYFIDLKNIRAGREILRKASRIAQNPARAYLNPTTGGKSHRRSLCYTRTDASLADNNMIFMKQSQNLGKKMPDPKIRQTTTKGGYRGDNIDDVGAHYRGYAAMRQEKRKLFCYFLFTNFYFYFSFA